MHILRILNVKHLGRHRLFLKFNNGIEGEVDLSDDLDGPIFRPLREPDFFSTVKLVGGTIAWPNGADIAPEFLATKMARQPTMREDPPES